jgi:hypothetical protein
MPRLVPPTASVRASYLQGERELAMEEGAPTSWIDAAAADFAGFVARRRAVRELWGVPVTELWFVDGSDYLGTVVIRHRLTRSWRAKAATSATTSCPATGGLAMPPGCSPRPSRPAARSVSPSC